MRVTTPQLQLSTANPVQDAAAAAVGVSVAAAHGDHAHPASAQYIAATANVMQFQNAADTGLKLQHVSSGSLTTSGGGPSVFSSSQAALSWPATFSSTPICWVGGSQPGSAWPQGPESVSTTGVTVQADGSVNTNSMTVIAFGIG